MMGFDPKQPYNLLPPLPPQEDVESKQILKLCMKARVALAELKQTARMLPNQGVLINTMPLLEAQASSEIENIVTTSDKLFQASDQQTQNLDPATKEALRYRTALFDGFTSLEDRPISTGTAELICSTLKGADMRVRKTSGTTLNNDLTGETIYTPPAGEGLLRDKLTNWEKFIHQEDELDPLVKMAIAHYQFEAIHPFTDGNGRTGRVINILYLIEKGLLDIPILYLSRYIIQNKETYYSLLQKVTVEGIWSDWIIYMLQAVYETASWTNNKITAILRLINETRDHVKENLPKVYSAELMDVLFNQPYCRIMNLQKENIAKRQTASEYLKHLCRIGVLREFANGREKLFINYRYLRLLITEALDYSPFEL